MIEKAILKINPNAEFTIIDNDINKITWNNFDTVKQVLQHIIDFYFYKKDIINILLKLK